MEFCWGCDLEGGQGIPCNVHKPDEFEAYEQKIARQRAESVTGGTPTLKAIDGWTRRRLQERHDALVQALGLPAGSTHAEVLAEIARLRKIRALWSPGGDRPAAKGCLFDHDPPPLGAGTVLRVDSDAVMLAGLRAAGFRVYDRDGYGICWEGTRRPVFDVFSHGLHGSDDRRIGEHEGPRTVASVLAALRAAGVSPDGKVAPEPLNHVRGAVRVGTSWFPVTALTAWGNGPGEDGATPGVWVEHVAGSVFEPGTTAEDFARRYGAAMGGGE